MSLSEKTKQCTGSFSCRYKVVIVAAAAVLLACIGAVLTLR